MVVGVAGNTEDVAVLNSAFDHARSVDAELVAVRAWLPDGGEFYSRLNFHSPVMDEYRRRAGEVLTEAFSRTFGGRPAGVDVRFVIGRGEVGPVLVCTADHPGDLLVVGGERGRSLAVMVRGSISRYCLAHAACPVLVVGEQGGTAGGRSPRHRTGLAARLPERRSVG